MPLCDPMDRSPPGSSVHGIPQDILAWVAVPSSKGSFQARNQTHVSYLYLHWQAGFSPLVPPGKPPYIHINVKNSAKIPKRTTEQLKSANRNYQSAGIPVCLSHQRLKTVHYPRLSLYFLRG